MTRLPRVALACLALALGAAFVTACGDDDESPSAGETAAPAATETVDTAGSEAESTSSVVVTMQGNVNMPAQIDVNVGQTIEWKNEDGYAHNVTSSDGASEKIESGNFTDSFEYAPKKAGSIPYVCTIHAGQTGEIAVK